MFHLFFETNTEKSEFRCSFLTYFQDFNNLIEGEENLKLEGKNRGIMTNRKKEQTVDNVVFSFKTNFYSCTCGMWQIRFNITFYSPKLICTCVGMFPSKNNFQPCTCGLGQL